jgi:hypothetical protein
MLDPAYYLGASRLLAAFFFVSAERFRQFACIPLGMLAHLSKAAIASVK